MVLVIDNYDSFTYNLVQLLADLGAEVHVARNDALSEQEAEALRPSALVISPGPGTPADGGISRALIRRFTGRIPILGVCLGHQCIAEICGGRVVPAPRPMHGKTSPIHHDGRGVFRGMASPFEATRYHSLLVADEELPQTLQVSARTSDGEIMGLRLREAPVAVEGVQFHPESVLTSVGRQLLGNFLQFGHPGPRASFPP